MDPTFEAWLQLLGRLHPVLVHFPIALLLVAFLFELFGLRKAGGGSSLTLLGLGAVGAAVAATAGWLWADFEPPSARDAGALDWHRWVGVATAVLALGAWILALVARKRSEGPFLGIARLLLLGSCVGVAVAGHQGGSLVHGEQHLNAPLEKAWSLTFGDGEVEEPADVVPAAEPASDRGGTDAEVSTGEVSSQEFVDGELVGELAGTSENVFDSSSDPKADEPALEEPFVQDVEITDDPTPVDVESPAVEVGDEAPTVAQVLAVFERHCADCHGPPPAKADAGLRLHNTSALAEGIGSDPLTALIVPGNVEGSYLYERISYPAGDGELMPPPDDGYERMADAEIALIAAWIAAGAPLDGGEAKGGAESAKVDTAEPIEDVVNEAAAESERAAEQVSESSDPFGVQGAPDAGALAALVQAGALAGRVAADTQAVEADLHLLRDSVGDDQLTWLAGLESHLVSLHLGGTAVSDAGLAALLPDFTQLRSLNVSRTSAGAATVAAAAALPQLEVLNLYGTQVTDADVLALAAAPALERLYLWDSQVTPEGGRALAQLRPDLKIDPAEWFAEPEEEVVELPPAEAVDYATQIAPLFEARCVNCHGANEPKAGLRLDDLAAHFARPEADWVLLPGDPDGSPLIRRVEYGASVQGAMPPKGERLELAQIELLRTWILQGAQY